jgi:hypothetical protein
MKNVALALTVVLSAATGASAQGNSQGTALSVEFDTVRVSCPAGDVSVNYTISTTAVNAAAVTTTFSGPAGFTSVVDSFGIAAGIAPAGGWTGSGRTKTYDGTVGVNGLADGSYSLEVCATQAGSNGNPSKTVCRTRTLEVNCADAGWNPCANEQFFGEVVGNTQIRENATAQVQFRGNFGEVALLEISTPDGFYRTASIGRNGNSCNYHANWKFMNESGADISGNAGPGVYTLKVSGDGRAREFSVTLSEARGGQK